MLIKLNAFRYLSHLPSLSDEERIPLEGEILRVGEIIKTFPKQDRHILKKGERRAFACEIVSE